MKRKYFLNLVGVAMLSLVVGCDKNTPSNSVDESSSSSSQESSNHLDSESSSSSQETLSFDYRLEEGETYNKINVKHDDLTDLTYNSIVIDGISKLAVNPYKVAYFSEQATVRTPTAALLQGQNILYTSAWYSRNTFARQDACVEYVLMNEDGDWYVSEISNSSSTFIPFNGAVLSLPKANASLDVGDYITFKKGSIPTYDIGFYNQDGMRLAVRCANKVSWNKNGVNLYDSNSISQVTPYLWDQLSSMNCYYDENKKAYVVDKFRFMKNSRRIYTNVHNGFILCANLTAGIESMATVEGIRFNEKDILQVEDNGAIHSQGYELALNSMNTLTLDSGMVLNFTITKKEDSTSDSPWWLEVGVDKYNTIVSTGSHVTVPKGGFKLVINPNQSTTGEQLNLLVENVFTRASIVIISGNNLYINSSSYQRIGGFYNQIASLLEDTMDDLANYNYSYDTVALNKISQDMKEIKRQMDQISLEDNATMLYRLYTLMGEVNQQYYKILSATNRNEAVQIKSCWYIYDFYGADKNLESIQKHLDTIKASGTNEIIVGAIENGAANYSNSKVFSTNFSIKENNYGKYGNDYLKAITEEAHLRGISVLGGFNPFTNGIENTWPELKNAYALSITGATTVSTSQGAVKMLDPANPLVQEKIYETIDDIFTSNPNLDGIHLDYIRFGADNNQINSVTGVTESALVQFNQYCQTNNYSYKANTLTELRTLLSTNYDAFSKFNAFQATLITDTVKNIKDACKKHDKPLTCAVADNSAYVKTWKCQDWGTWAKLGYVDALYLMDYYFDEYFVNYYFEDMLKATSNQTMLVTGIDPSYANLISEYYARVIKGGVSNVNSHGYAIFGSHTQDAKKDGWDLIKDSNWIDSISPYDDLKDTMKASGDLLLKRCDDIYIHYGNQSEAQKQQLENDLNTLYSLIKQENSECYEAVMAQLESMISKNYANNEASKRIVEQLEYMHKIAFIKLNIIKD